MLHSSKSKTVSPWVMVAFTMNLIMLRRLPWKHIWHFEFSPGIIKYHINSLGPSQATYKEATKTKTSSSGEIKSHGRNRITLQRNNNRIRMKRSELWSDRPSSILMKSTWSNHYTKKHQSFCSEERSIKSSKRLSSYLMVRTQSNFTLTLRTQRDYHHTWW